MKKPLTVVKFGGSSLATPEMILNAAQRVKSIKQAGHNVIVIVSAMGQSTNDLTHLAFKVSPTPNRRELDMLLSTGERVSMALMSIALQDIGCEAISFTGSQAGVLTTDNHNEAELKELKPIRVDEALSQNKIVVVAGFQGVDPLRKEVTTLGRGGSDITAIAFANHYNADECLFLKDVQGVFSADPKAVPSAIHIPEVSHQFLYNSCLWGAQVLHPKSVEYAKQAQRKFKIGDSTQAHLTKTCVQENITQHTYAVTGFNNVFKFKGPQKFSEMEEELKSYTPTLRIFNNSKKRSYYLFSPDQNRDMYLSILKKYGALIEDTYSSISIIAPHTDFIDIEKIAAASNIEAEDRFTSEISYHFVVNKENRPSYTQKIHDALVKG